MSAAPGRKRGCLSRRIGRAGTRANCDNPNGTYIPVAAPRTSRLPRACPGYTAAVPDIPVAAPRTSRLPRVCPGYTAAEPASGRAQNVVQRSGLPIPGNQRSRLTAERAQHDFGRSRQHVYEQPTASPCPDSLSENAEESDGCSGIEYPASLTETDEEGDLEECEPEMDPQREGDDDDDDVCDDDYDDQEEAVRVDLEQIAHDVFYEKRDVSMAEKLAQQHEVTQHLDASAHQDAQSIEISEMSPQNLAQIMHMEERGLPMTSPPYRIVDFLFPGAKDPLSSVSAVTSPAEGAAVPVRTKESGSPIPDKMKQAVAMLEASFRATPQYKDLTISNVGAASGEPEWMDFDDVTGVPHLDATRRDSLQLSPAKEANFNLDTTAPAHHTRIQLRGSCKPWWFPGYYSVLPGSDVITLSRSASATLVAAHKAVNPNAFSPENHLIVESSEAGDE